MRNIKNYGSKTIFIVILNKVKNLPISGSYQRKILRLKPQNDIMITSVCDNKDIRNPACKFWIPVFTICILVLYPSLSYAHVEQGQAAGFLTGLEHPWSGLDHVLAMIAVGLWGAQLGNPAIWLLPVVFPMVMAAGALLGLIGIPVPGVEAGIALSALLLGSMVFGEVRPGLTAAALLVGFFAVFHGHAHGTELPAGQSGLLYSMGFVIATGCLHELGIGIGIVHRWHAGKLALRGAGAFIAGMGLVFLWRTLS